MFSVAVVAVIAMISPVFILSASRCVVSGQKVMSTIFPLFISKKVSIFSDYD